MALALAHAVFASPAGATGLLRDADIEHSLDELSASILRAAGLSPERIRVLVVNDGSINAFVIDNQNIYVHYGLLLRSENAPMLQAVIAHEAAHIANGHITRRIENADDAVLKGSLGMLAGMVAMGVGAGEAAIALIFGTQGGALRGLLAHTRAEESAADRSALTYLVKSMIDPTGMVEVHSIFGGHDVLTEASQDLYSRSHPMTSDRVRAAKDFVGNQKSLPSSNPEHEYLFQRMQGKLSAFTRDPKWTLQQLEGQEETEIVHMRKAIAHHRLRQVGEARRHMEAVLAAKPDDPYYLDLLGQIMLESRQWREALEAYESAAEGAPENAMVLSGYGNALLALRRPEEALEVLVRARGKDGNDEYAAGRKILSGLARAYAETGNIGMSALSTAELHAQTGNFPAALPHARRAVNELKEGTTAWRRAKDILDTATPPETE